MRISLKTALCSLALALANVSSADDWPQWLGPKRDGVWREQGILEKFPAGGPPVLWRVPVNGGYAGPAVVGNRLYVTDRKAGKPLERKPGERGIPSLPGTERILCLDTTTGKSIWEHSYDCAYRIDYPSGPRATPLVADGKVYTLGAMGDLLCFNAESGEVLWARHFLKDFNLTDPPDWGWAAHPLIEGNRVICLVGGEGSAVVAFDKETGKELWRALSTKEICYAPPMMAELGGKRQLIIWHSEAISSLNPATGKAFWTQPYPVEGKPQRPEVCIATPRVAGDLLFVSSFYQGALMLKLTAEPPAAKVLWNRKSSSKSAINDGLHTVMSTSVIRDGYVYGVCGMGELRCLDANTGDRIWESYAATGGKQNLFGTAFFVEHKDRYFIWNDQGELLLGRLDAKGFQEISRARLLEPKENARGRDVVWSHPAFANRCAYIRNHQELISVLLAAPRPE
jgi:outer membrane protein assembly factor BamB